MTRRTDRRTDRRAWEDDDDGEDDGESWEHPRDPVPVEWRLRVFVLGRWYDYGLHGERQARAMAAAHSARGRPVQLARERLTPGADSLPGQQGLPLVARP